MRSVAELILKEWNQFQQVRNEGGRASCQNHMKEFVMNRLAQFLTWDDAMRESYYEDLTEAESRWLESADGEVCPHDALYGAGTICRAVQPSAGDLRAERASGGKKSWRSS